MMDLLHSLTLGDVLAEHSRSRPCATALVCGGERLSYPDLDIRVNCLANSFMAEGLAVGDRILWIGQNCHRLLESLLAAARCGAVLCPANWRQSAEELVTLVEDCRPSYVIWQQEEIGEAAARAREILALNPTVPAARWLLHDAPKLAEVTEEPGACSSEGTGGSSGGNGIGGTGRLDGNGGADQAGTVQREPSLDTYERFLAQGHSAYPQLEVDPSWPVLQLYTAAFAGKPQGAQLSHSAILAQDLVIAMLQGITAETIYLNSGPMFHVATLMSTFATFRMGGTNVMTRRVDAEELCRLIEAERCTLGLLMGPTVDQILELNSDHHYDLSSLRTFPGRPEWNAMVGRDDSAWGRNPAGYGQTELCGLLTFNALGVGAAGSSGRPSPLVQVKIVDPEGRDVPVGETGEIICRGPIVMNGYFDRKDVNVRKQRGGWHHTGDLGKREPDGSVTFVGPMTRIIKSGAENIYPAEVEGCLGSHPAVREAAVIGVPDHLWTQRVLAVVSLKEDASATEAELVQYCREHIASYKKPSAVVFVDSLPRKGFAVDYGDLDERFGGGGYPGEL